MIRSCSGELYRILGVEKTADENDIKRAYRRKALLVHPDRTGGQTTAEFQQLQEAESIIGDPKLRKVYDTFGRKGVSATRMGVDANVMEMLQHGGVLRAIIFLIWLLFVLHVIFLSLVLAKIDEPKPTWSWVAVFTPVWIDLALILPSACAGVVKGILGRLPSVVVISLRTILLCVGAILFARSLDGAAEWKGAFGMLLAAMGLGAIMQLNSLRPTVIKGSLTESGRLVDAEHFTVVSLMFVMRAIGVLCSVVLPIAFVCALYGNIVSGDRTSYFGVFAPLYIYVGVMVCLAIYEVVHRAELSCGAKVCAGLSSSMSYAGALYTIVMVSVKCQKELIDGVSGPSATVCCIPLIVSLAVPVLGLCCACCAPLPTGMPEEGDYHTPEGGTGDGEGAEYTPHPEEPVAQEYTPLQSP